MVVAPIQKAYQDSELIFHPAHPLSEPVLDFVQVSPDHKKQANPICCQMHKNLTAKHFSLMSYISWQHYWQQSP